MHRTARPHRTTPTLLAIALAAAPLGLAGCWPTDYGTDGCSPDDAPPVADWWAGDGVTDVTFLAFGDSQIYLSSDGSNDDGGGKNALHVQALNVADSLSWDPVGLSEPVANVRGVIMAGDITQNGRDAREAPADEYGLFTSLYGLCGNRQLRWPMYEGYGNHDYRSWFNFLYWQEHPVADSVSVRHPFRAGLANQAPGTDGHYSWDWDGIHFVNVNLAASDVDPALPDGPVGMRDPRSALTFLQDDLAAVGTSTPVVVIQHYYPNGSTFEWDQAQIQAFEAAIAPYDVIAILYGHAHNTSIGTWNGIPIYNVGSPYYMSYNPDNRGHYAVMRITDDKIYAYDASWNPDAPTELQAPSVWTRVVDR